MQRAFATAHSTRALNDRRSSVSPQNITKGALIRRTALPVFPGDSPIAHLVYSSPHVPRHSWILPGARGSAFGDGQWLPRLRAVGLLQDSSTDWTATE